MSGGFDEASGEYFEGQDMDPDLAAKLQEYREGVYSEDLQMQSMYTMHFRKLLSKGGFGGLGWVGCLLACGGSREGATAGLSAIAFRRPDCRRVLCARHPLSLTHSRT